MSADGKGLSEDPERRRQMRMLAVMLLEKYLGATPEETPQAGVGAGE
jgi:hypothetical protein